jgi:hypothetical protein
MGVKMTPKPAHTHTHTSYCRQGRKGSAHEPKQAQQKEEKMHSGERRTQEVPSKKELKKKKHIGSKWLVKKETPKK